MWRAVFLAVGVILCILGLECLVVDSVVVASPPEIDSVRAAGGGLPSGHKVIEPPGWAPWSLLSGGTIVILYALTMKNGG